MASDTPILDLWLPLLWASKPEWEDLFTQCEGIHPQRFTPADILANSMAAKLFSSMYL